MNSKIILFSILSKSRLYGITEKEHSAIQPHICMGLLSSYLKSKNIEVEIIDETANWSIPDFVNYINKEKPLLAGVICSGANPSSSTMAMVGAINFFKEYNKTPCKETKTFILGGHPSVEPERTLKETGVDFVIIGEGYKTILELYNKVQLDTIPGLAYIEHDGVYYNTGFPELIDVNTLPTIDWEQFKPNKYRAHNWHCFGNIKDRSPYAVIWTTFGCPYSCSFCCINNIFGKSSYRKRDIKLVLEEIDILVQKYNVTNIKILDELFITKHERINEFCEGLEKRKYNLNLWAYGRLDTTNKDILNRLNKVGLNWISFGFESINPKNLESVNKGYKLDYYEQVVNWTKEANINICADFIAGLWEDDYESLEATYEFMVKCNFEWVNLYPCFAYPGTKMYNNYLKDGIIEEPKDWEEYALYGYKCKPCPTKYLTREQVLKWRDDIFIKYHSRPDYLKMIEQKFGLDTVIHIEKMVKQQLRRKMIDEEIFTKLTNEKITCFPSQEVLFKETFKKTKIDGLYLEFGLWRGFSANDILKIVPDKILYGFDSFMGLEEDFTINAKVGNCALKENEIPTFQKNIKLVKGRIQDTLLPFLAEYSEPIAFIHFDIPYLPTKFVLEELTKRKRIVPGTTIQFSHAFGRGEKTLELEQKLFKTLKQWIKDFNIKFDYIGLGDKVHISIIVKEDITYD